MYELLIPILTFFSVVALGGAVLVLRSRRSDQLRSRLDHTAPPATQRDATPAFKPRLIDLVEGVGIKVSSGGPSPKLRQSLAEAGYYADHAAALYMGTKLFLLVAGLVALWVLLLPVEQPLTVKGMMVVTGGGLLSFLPNLFVHMRRRERRAEVRRHLPDALDLLEISVSSGMGLDTSWNSVAEQIRAVSRTLADEMALTNLELHLGAPRAVAMRHMAERTGAEEISSLVGVLLQSERFGTSIAQALRTFSETMRETRSSRAEVAAEKMAVTLLFPMVLFIFPAILVVTVGPAAVVLFEIMGGG